MNNENNNNMENNTSGCGVNACCFLPIVPAGQYMDENGKGRVAEVEE